MAVGKNGSVRPGTIRRSCRNGTITWPKWPSDGPNNNMQKNRIEVAGFLSAKPAVRYLPSGTPVANARLGESYSFKDSEGKLQKHTNWHSLSFYGELSSIAATYDKGDNLFIEGSIEQRQFVPKSDGVKRTVHEIVVRSCHLIAAPAMSLASETLVPEAEDDPWPIQ
jgi:single-strand DNA-binding protein